MSGAQRGILPVYLLDIYGFTDNSSY
jgi:hypothetical protein